MSALLSSTLHPRPLRFGHVLEEVNEVRSKLRSRRAALAAGVAVLVAAVAGGAAIAAGGDDDASDTPITGAALGKAKAAALAHTGSGKVTGTEAGDEESAYEVEVTLANGDQVDVQLDESFHVVGSKADGDDQNEQGDD